MKGIRQKIVRLLNSPWVAPFSVPLKTVYGGRLTCLCYHRVETGESDPGAEKGRGFFPNRILSVSESRFDEQMDCLARNGRAVPLSEGVKALRDGGLRRGSVVVTFDDGYRDNLKTALPVLERHGIPAVIYITTGLIDRSTSLWWNELEFIIRRSSELEFAWKGTEYRFKLADDAVRNEAYERVSDIFKSLTVREREELIGNLRGCCPDRYSYDDEVLSWDEVRELDRHPLITIGAHTVNHPALKVEAPETAAREMRDSRQRLEAELGHPVPHFAYPFGGREHAGPRDFDLCSSEGFESAVTTRAGHWFGRHSAHLHALPRLMIEYFDRIEDFEFKLTGLDAFLQQRGRRFVTN